MSRADPGDVDASQAKHLGLVFGLYGLITIFMTWPQARDPASLGLAFPDMFGHTWGLAWVVHQPVADPIRLFESNVYWPAPASLATTEILLPQALMVSPILLLGGDPLLAHNIGVLLIFPLAGLGAYLLALDLTGSRAGAFLAGLAYAFSAFRWEHFIHIGVLSNQWLPFALLFLRRSLRSPRRLNLLALAFFCILQALSSGYYAILLAIAIAASLAFHVRELLEIRRSLPVLITLALTAILLLPVGLPYRSLHKRKGIYRSHAELVHGSARPKSYLDPGRMTSWPHLKALRSWTAEREPLYPGAITLLLAATSLLRRRRSEAVRYGAVLSLAGLAASFGPAIPVGDGGPGRSRRSLNCRCCG